MSAKKEKELREKIAVCEELGKQHGKFLELHKETSEELTVARKAAEDMQRRIMFLERDVDRLRQWRYECIERRMERAVQIRMIRKAFGVAAAILWLVFFVVCLLVDAEVIGMLPGTILLVGFGGLGYVCIGKAGWLGP